MLADAEGVDADLVGQHALVDDVADDLGVGQRLPSGPIVTSPNVSSPNSKFCAIRSLFSLYQLGPQRERGTGAPAMSDK